MKKLEVLEVPKMPPLPDGYVFNSSEFLSLKTGEYRFFVLYQDKEPMSRINFSCTATVALSGAGATFGSFDSANLDDPEAIQYFVEAVIAQLLVTGFKTISIRLPTLAYTNVKLIEEQLIKLNFGVSSTEINQHLVINSAPYENRIKYNEKKKLKQSQAYGYRFTALGLNSLTDVYQLISATRERKDYPVTMTYDELFATIKTLPDKYLIFGLFDKEVLVAATISIRVSEKVLYNFYHADHIDYRTRSPLVMLVGSIYNYCQKEKIEMLDLGISTNAGELNPGLYKFKKNLGCVESQKNTLTLSHA